MENNKQTEGNLLFNIILIAVLTFLFVKIISIVSRIFQDLRECKSFFEHAIAEHPKAKSLSKANRELILLGAIRIYRARVYAMLLSIVMIVFLFSVPEFHISEATGMDGYSVILILCSICWLGFDPLRHLTTLKKHVLNVLLDKYPAMHSIDYTTTLHPYEKIQ